MNLLLHAQDCFTIADYTEVGDTYVLHMKNLSI